MQCANHTTARQGRNSWQVLSCHSTTLHHNKSTFCTHSSCKNRGQRPWNRLPVHLERNCDCGSSKSLVARELLLQRRIPPLYIAPTVIHTPETYSLLNMHSQQLLQHASLGGTSLTCKLKQSLPKVCYALLARQEVDTEAQICFSCTMLSPTMTKRL